MSSMRPAARFSRSAVDLLLLLLLVVACCCPTARALPAPNINFQIHSWNDLREWPQMLAKGARWIKIDPHYETAAFCVTQQRYSGDPRGCFVLIHDAPSRLVNYFVLDDVLQFLTDPQNQYLIEGPEPLTIALCFKTDGFQPCDGSQQASDWISLVDAFYANATAAIAQYHLNVSFVLDGSGTPGGLEPTRTCLDNKFPLWPATYQPNSDPPGAFTSNSSAGWDRFSVLDPPAAPALVWELVAAAGFGKFAHLPAPYLLWEPANQSDILHAAAVYNGHAQPPHPAGLRFAINIDPAMFQVYAAPQSGFGSNADIGSAAAGCDAPRVLVLGAGDRLRALYVCHSGGSSSDAALSYATAPVAGAMQPLQPSTPRPVPGPLPANVTLAGAATLPAAGDLQTVLLLSGNGSLYVLASKADELAFVTAQPLLAGRRLTGLAAAPLDRQVLVAQLLDTDGCPVALQLWAASSPLQTPFVPVGRGPVCLAPSVPGGVDSAAVAVAVASNAGDSLCPAGELQLLSLVATTDQTLYGLSGCVDSHTGAWSPLADLAPVHVGAWPSLASTIVNGAAVFAEVHGESYCPNNEVDNKRAAALLCDNTPQSTPHILSYSLATFESWTMKLRSKLPLGPCDVGFVHGAYDQGRRPSQALLVDGAGTLGLVEAHEGYRDADVDLSDCGTPVARAAAVTDAWDVSPFVRYVLGAGRSPIGTPPQA